MRQEKQEAAPPRAYRAADRLLVRTGRQGGALGGRRRAGVVRDGRRLARLPGRARTRRRRRRLGWRGRAVAGMVRGARRAARGGLRARRPRIGRRGRTVDGVAAPDRARSRARAGDPPRHRGGSRRDGDATRGQRLRGRPRGAGLRGRGRERGHGRRRHRGARPHQPVALRHVPDRRAGPVPRGAHVRSRRIGAHDALPVRSGEDRRASRGSDLRCADDRRRRDVPARGGSLARPAAGAAPAWHEPVAREHAAHGAGCAARDDRGDRRDRGGRRPARAAGRSARARCSPPPSTCSWPPRWAR